MTVECQQVHCILKKNSPERNTPGLLTLLRLVLFQGSHLLQIILKALEVQEALAPQE